jgi:hypothetical protein
MSAAFYVRDGDHFCATEYTRGPWSRTMQHGGPPSALLVRAIEQHAEASDLVIARLGFDFLRPVPIGRFTVEVEPQRAGKRVARVLARLVHEGTCVLQVSALQIKRTAIALPSPRCPRHTAPRGPAGLEPFTFPFFRDTPSYQSAVELRIARGVWGKGAATAWMRLAAALVDGEATSPLQALVSLADATNGVCPVLDTRAFTFVNADLTLHLDRVPVGEWFALDARSTADAMGVGLTQSELFDRDGEIGRVLGSLVIDHRDEAGAIPPARPTMER